MIDDDDDDGNSRSAGTKNVLVQASTFEKAIAAIKLVMNRSEYESIYNTIKLLQELNIVDVFIPDESVSYYSDSELSGQIHLEHHKLYMGEINEISEKIKKL
jgi:Fe2+ or Zn2+ uptake regulation protein